MAAVVVVVVVEEDGVVAMLLVEDQDLKVAGDRHRLHWSSPFPEDGNLWCEAAVEEDAKLPEVQETIQMPLLWLPSQELG